MIPPSPLLRGYRLARLAFACAAGLVLAWSPLRADERNTPEAFASPSRGEILAPGALLEVRWNAECEAREADRDFGRDRDGKREREANEAELVLSLDGGMTFPIRVSGELSPCASRFTWRVPALPTSQARIGLRTGEDESDEEERIELLSAAFTILPDPERRPETLYARGGEWWIPEAPARRGLEDGLRRTLHGAASQIALPVAWTEISVPAAPVLARPPAGFARLLPARPLTKEPSVLSLASAPSAPTPLRC
jgi:hypothetical protein